MVENLRMQFHFEIRSNLIPDSDSSCLESWRIRLYRILRLSELCGALTPHPGPGILCSTGVFFFAAFFVITLPKMISKRRASRFYTICDKNRLLNTNIEKVTAVLVLRSWDAVPLGQVVPPGSDARWVVES
jgi:hypothetical protein